MNAIVKVENLSKQYRLGQVGVSTLKDDFKRLLYQVRGKDDPLTLVGETNDRSKKGKSEYVWSLKDINFQVMPGQVLGIIGKNGAGKSTLLKILSQVTSPTTGLVKIKGRVASLLEVGTGFHPDLTGRENIYLNGSILGMRKKEIEKKLDEIIEFSGVERYIDTPVKRYSSGMYVRLAFAVAAHLDPEILIVDEVLAVGDAEFQKKCLGKMKEVSANQGRTVLFVSHNLIAVQKLCDTILCLENGTVGFNGSVTSGIGYYQREILIKNKVACKPSLNSEAEIISVEFIGSETGSARIGESWKIVVQVQVNKNVRNFICASGIVTKDSFALNTTWTKPLNAEPGIYEFVFTNSSLHLAPSNYLISIGISDYMRSIQFLNECISFEICEILDSEEIALVHTISSGVVSNQLETTIKRLDAIAI